MSGEEAEGLEDGARLWFAHRGIGGEQDALGLSSRRCVPAIRRSEWRPSLCRYVAESAVGQYADGHAVARLLLDRAEGHAVSLANPLVQRRGHAIVGRPAEVERACVSAVQLHGYPRLRRVAAGDASWREYWEECSPSLKHAEDVAMNWQ